MATSYSPLATRAGQGRDDLGGILIIGVHHHHDIGAQFQGFGVTGLLVAAIAHIPLMQKTPDAESPGHLHRLIVGGVVHQQDFIHHVKGDVLKGAFQGLGGVIGRHDHQHFFPGQHASLSPGYLL